MRILSAAKAAAGASPADNATGGAVLRALCRERADSSAVAWALKALPPEQDFFAMLLQHYRARGSRKVRSRASLDCFSGRCHAQLFDLLFSDVSVLHMLDCSWQIFLFPLLKKASAAG